MKKRFLQALEPGITEVWQLTEHFDLSEDLIHKAFEIYESDLIRTNTKDFGEY